MPCALSLFSSSGENAPGLAGPSATSTGARGLAACPGESANRLMLGAIRHHRLRRQAQYGAFAANVAKRYSPKGFNTFEIWNEPNDAQAKPLAGG